MTRRKLSSSSLSNATPESNNRWTLFSAKQNLATVLNDPNRGKQRDYFTKYWGPDFIEKSRNEIPKHPYLPEVDRSHFESYFKKISRVLWRFEQT